VISDKVTIAASKIYLDEMHFYAYHGVMEQERLVGGEYSASLIVEADLTEAARTDDVADTINYATLYELVKSEMAIPSKLLEHVAGRIGRRAMETFEKITALTIRVTKVNPPMGADSKGASVELKMIR
jgi:dihydroneopterin aldolase